MTDGQTIASLVALARYHRVTIEQTNGAPSYRIDCGEVFGRGDTIAEAVAATVENLGAKLRAASDALESVKP